MAVGDELSWQPPILPVVDDQHHTGTPSILKKDSDLEMGAT